mmetsp:Transcript_13277/g.32265  ORF Transcript_13277/g.32265 Transcript_13277/m.32265 type:complete len:252 (+) Transcript_13277:910-1665(+)
MLRRGDGVVVRVGRHGAGAHVEGHPRHAEAQHLGHLQQPRHGLHAGAVLTAKLHLGLGVIGADTQDHCKSRHFIQPRCLNLVQLGLGVEGGECDAMLGDAAQVDRAFHRVRQDDAAGGDAQVAHELHLACRGAVEAGAQRSQRGDDPTVGQALHSEVRSDTRHGGRHVVVQGPHCAKVNHAEGVLEPVFVDERQGGGVQGSDPARGHVLHVEGLHHRGQGEGRGHAVLVNAVTPLKLRGGHRQAVLKPQRV